MYSLRWSAPGHSGPRPSRVAPPSPVHRHHPLRHVRIACPGHVSRHHPRRRPGYYACRGCTARRRCSLARPHRHPIHPYVTISQTTCLLGSSPPWPSCLGPVDLTDTASSAGTGSLRPFHSFNRVHSPRSQRAASSGLPPHYGVGRFPILPWPSFPQGLYCIILLAR